MADFAIPQSFSISDVKRNSMPAVRRTVIHGSTTQNTYGPGEQIDIPVDTGTSGSFFDPQTSRIDMTVNVYNPNYFVDFINLPRCGFHALFEQFSVIIHNTEHETQRYYTEMIELEMVRHGENIQPFELTMSNPHKVGSGIAGDLHINLIKPSMITTAGLPHGVKYGVLTQPSGSNIASSVANDISEGLLLNAHPYLKRPYGRLGYAEIDDLVVNTKTTGGFVGLNSNVGTGYKNQFGWWAETSLPSSSMYDDQITVRGETICKTSKVATFSSSGTVNTGLTNHQSRWDSPPVNNVLSVPTGTSYAYDNQILTSNRFVGYRSHGGNYSKIYPYVGSFGTGHPDNTMFDVDYGQTLGGYTPMMWPAKQPTDMTEFMKMKKEALRGVNTKNVQNYYANCKNIPIGIPIDLTNDEYGEAAIWGDSSHALPSKSDSRGQKYCFRVSLKLYSCIFGVFAKKMFPSLLIGAGRVRLRFRLQQPNIAFQTLMDPCRIVPHTARDRFAYMGIWQNSDDQNSTITTLDNLTSGDVSCIAHGIHPILLSNYEAGECFNDMVCIGRHPIPQQRMKAISRPLDTFTGRVKMGMADPVNLMGGSTSGYAIDSSFNTEITKEAGASIYGPPINYNIVSLLPRNEYSSVSNPITDGNTTWQNFVQASLTLPVSSADVEAVYGDTILGGSAATWKLAYDRYLNGLNLKIINDVITEFSDNVHYGYPPNVIVANSQYVDVDNAEDVGVTIYDNKNQNRTPGSSCPVFALQNYHYATDWSALFSNHQSTQGDYKFKGGDRGTTQMLWHPAQSAATAPTSDFPAKGLNWDPFQPPVPQYVPIKEPWNKSSSRSLVSTDFLNERDLCYGTFLERSVAQVRRTNKNLFPLGNSDSTYYPGMSERVTYTISNVAYRVEEIILPEAASLQIISAAMEGGITMETSQIKSIEQILQRQDNQKILLNVSAGVVDDICFTFQPTEIYQSDKAYGYNSFATYCPYTSFRFILQSEGTKDSNGSIIPAPSTPDNYNYLGGEPNYYNALSFGEHIGINTYLTIGTEPFPRMPINDLQTLIDHVTWGDQRRGDFEYLGLEPMWQNSYDTSNFQKIIPFQDGFFSVFTPIECLNDQTITDNPYWTPLECNIKTLIRGIRAKKPALPLFKPTDGTYHFSFNLQAFMYQEERMNVGLPMVNNNAYLQMQNCHLLREYETRMMTHIRCFARVVIERGGIVQIFT